MSLAAHYRCWVAIVVGLLLAAVACSQRDTELRRDVDVIVVGAGLAGLSAAVEMGRAGVEVLVIDTNSVAGGHAVLAGGVALVGTPVQERSDIHDSPDLAYEDWMQWTEDGDPEWTRYYAEVSREMIFDWTTELGVEYVRVVPSHGNSVPRFHFTRGRALHIVMPIFRAALKIPNVSFLWNTRVEKLLLEDDRIGGVVVQDLRSGAIQSLEASHVVLATGGFASDLARVRANWMPGLPQPDRLLIGSAVSAIGAGHDMATDVGAALIDLDRHYIYIDGVLDPRDAEGRRALTAGNNQSMWVNAQGERFTNELGFDKDILVDLLQQERSTYWAIFDESTRADFVVRGAAWLKNPAQGHPVLDHPQLTRRAQSLPELAAAAGLPAVELEKSVRRFNKMIDAGQDRDFGRFAVGGPLPSKIEQAPYYAVQMFPMTRKSMGGVAVDRETRVLNAAGEVITGLYAVGELNGSVGVNGKHGLDGMFLGPAILTGRIAGRSIAAHCCSERQRLETELPSLPAAAEIPAIEMTSADLESLLTASRNGYWHFQVSHHLVLERGYECERCHSLRVPFGTPVDRLMRMAQTELCVNCH